MAQVLKPTDELRAALTAERQELCDKLERLNRFYQNGKIDGDLAPEDLQLLSVQRDIMIDYVDVLDERIARLKP